MFRMGIIAGIACVALAGCNTTSSTKAVTSGQTIRVNYYSTLNADCTSMGQTVVRVVDGPASGRISVTQTVGNSTFRQGNQRYHCNAMKTPGTLVTYTPNPGFKGTDRVTLDAIFANGMNLSKSYNIVVK